MTDRKDLPEDAGTPPRTMTPDELAEHYRRRGERTAQAEEQGEPLDPAHPESPVREPGEPSSAAPGALPRKR